MSNAKETLIISKDEEDFASRKLLKILKEKDEFKDFALVLNNFIIISNLPNEVFYAINLCYMQYFNDYKKRYKSEEIVLNFKNLGRNINYLKKNECSLSLNYFINEKKIPEKVKSEN